MKFIEDQNTSSTNYHATLKLEKTAYLHGLYDFSNYDRDFRDKSIYLSTYYGLVTASSQNTLVITTGMSRMVICSTYDPAIFLIKKTYVS